MTVQEAMSRDVAAVTTASDVAEAVAKMREHDCGFLPVVDSRGLVFGVLTDRDVCLAAGASDRPLARVSVLSIMTRPVVSCLADDTLQAALETMSKHRVRRLPVIDTHGHLEGVISVDDIVRISSHRGSPSTADIVVALIGIESPRPIERATS